MSYGCPYQTEQVYLTNNAREPGISVGSRFPRLPGLQKFVLKQGAKEPHKPSQTRSFWTLCSTFDTVHVSRRPVSLVHR